MQFMQAHSAPFAAGTRQSQCCNFLNRKKWYLLFHELKLLSSHTFACSTCVVWWTFFLSLSENRVKIAWCTWNADKLETQPCERECVFWSNDSYRELKENYAKMSLPHVFFRSLPLPEDGWNSSTNIPHEQSPSKWKRSCEGMQRSFFQFAFFFLFAFFFSYIFSQCKTIYILRGEFMTFTERITSLAHKKKTPYEER